MVGCHPRIEANVAHQSDARPGRDGPSPSRAQRSQPYECSKRLKCDTLVMRRPVASRCEQVHLSLPRSVPMPKHRAGFCPSAGERGAGSLLRKPATRSSGRSPRRSARRARRSLPEDVRLHKGDEVCIESCGGCWLPSVSTRIWRLCPVTCPQPTHGRGPLGAFPPYPKQGSLLHADPGFRSNAD